MFTPSKAEDELRIAAQNVYALLPNVLEDSSVNLV